MRFTIKSLVSSLLVAAAVSLGVGGCAVDDEPGVATEEVQQAISFTTLEVEKQNASAGLTVIKSKAAFKTFFGVEAPAGLSFNKSWVVHVSAGMRSTGGYSIEVLGLRRVGQTLVVSALETEPGDDCSVTKMITHPQMAVVINKQPAAKNSSLETIVEVSDCGVTCGGRSGNDCGTDEYCDFEGEMCDWADAQGTCQTRPEICTEEYAPVVGCNGETYSNECHAHMAGVDAAHAAEEPKYCGGWVGNTCAASEYCDFEGEMCDWADASGTCQVRPEACPQVYEPVTGCNGQTYSNECFAHMAGTDAAYH